MSAAPWLPALLAAAVAGALLVGGSHALPHTWTPVLRPTVLGCLVAAGGATAAITFLDGTQVVVALVALAVAAAAAREVRRRRRTIRAARRAEMVLATCEGLAADVRAGQPPVAALASAARDWPELTPVAAAARLGADVPGALRALAGQPGASALRAVAAAWHVGHRSGAGLASTLALTAEQLRGERATARVLATELAAAQATARLLAVLPAGVLLLGSGLGGDPVGFLLATPAGLACLCAGLALEYAGLCWLARIADQVTGRR